MLGHGLSIKLSPAPSNARGLSSLAMGTGTVGWWRNFMHRRLGKTLEPPETGPQRIDAWHPNLIAFRLETKQ